MEKWWSLVGEWFSGSSLLPALQRCDGLNSLYA